MTASSRHRAATGCAMSAEPRSCSCAATTARCGRSATPAATGARRSCAASAGRRDCSCASSTRGATTSRAASCGCPDERDFVGLRTDDRGLPPVRCERWGGWYFVTFDDDAVAARRLARPDSSGCSPRWPRLPLRVIDEKRVTLGCNWKILAEAFLEVYHARTIHPKTVGPSLDTRGTVISAVRPRTPEHAVARQPRHPRRPARAAADVGRRHRDLHQRRPAGVRDLPQPHHARSTRVGSRSSGSGRWRSTARGSTSRGSPPTGARARCRPSSGDLGRPPHPLRHRDGRGLRRTSSRSSDRWRPPPTAAR